MTGSWNRRPGAGDEMAPPLLLPLTAWLARCAWPVILAGAGLGFVVGVVTLLAPRTYESRAAFVSDAGPDVGGAAALAAQFGITAGGRGQADGPDAYARRLRSDSLLRATVVGEFRFRRDGEARIGSLIAAFKLEETAPVPRDIAVAVLRQRMRVAVELLSGIVSVTVATDQAELSAQIVQALLRQLEDATGVERRRRMEAEREFTATQLADQRRSLESGERALQQFLERNRNYGNSPQLSLEAERLRRAVTLEQQVYISLAQAAAQAGIEAARNTPRIRILEQPVVPSLPARRFLMIKTVLGGAAGAVLALVWLTVRRLLARSRGLPTGSTARRYLRRWLRVWRARLARVRRRRGRGV